MAGPKKITSAGLFSIWVILWLVSSPQILVTISGQKAVKKRLADMTQVSQQDNYLDYCDL